MYNSSSNSKKYVALIIIGVLALLAIVTFVKAFVAVDTGNVGVVTNYGRVTGREVSEGVSFIAPWTEDVAVYDIKNQKEEVQSGAATKDLQDVSGTLVLNYQLLRGEVSKIHQEVGVDYKDKLITPALNETFKAAAAKYNASELVTQRAEVKNDVYTGLKNRLEKYGISVLDVSITNFNFSAEFNKAIEAVQIANQEVAKAKQQLEQAKIDAEKKIAEAEGAAESQRLQQQTLTQELLEKQWIEKWSGEVPKYISGSGSENFMFNIGE